MNKSKQKQYDQQTVANENEEKLIFNFTEMETKSKL